MLYLLALLFVIWLVWRMRHPQASPSNRAADAQYQAPELLAQSHAARDRQWRQYIASFQSPNLSPASLQLLEVMLAGVAAPDAPRPTGATVAADSAAVEIPRSVLSLPAPPPPPSPKPRQELDGTLLLLYFGAFLFVAAAGLFVAFGGLSGGIRTLFVVMTMAVLYGGGFWLYDRSPRLMPAGTTFVAIGMAIAPLVGLAAYQYLAGKQHAGIIWLLTSLLAMAMYIYALKRLRATFISYLVIFSFVSLFESAVAITDASLQYYVWMLVIAGLVLRLFGFIKENPDLEQPAAVSAQIIIPLSLAVSLYLLPSRGVGQLGITMLLAAVFYSFEAFQRRQGRENLLLAAHLLYVLGITVTVYTLYGTGLAVALALLLVALVHAVLIEVLPPTTTISRNLASIAFVSGLPVVFLAYPRGVLMVIAVGVLGLIGEITARRQRRPDAYAGAALALITLPLVVGQYALVPHLSASLQTAGCFVPLLVLWGLWSWISEKRLSTDWQRTAQVLYVLAGVGALSVAAFGGGWLFMAASLVFAATLAEAARSGAGKAWWVAAGMVASLPILREAGASDGRIFSVAVLVALVVNGLIALASRAEPIRWLVTLLALLTPLALGNGGLGMNWSPAGFAYAYLVVTALLILCRCLARGVYLASSKVVLISLCRSASLSYVVGYVASAALALGLSLASVQSRLHTSLILLALTGLTIYITVIVEKSRRLWALVPWLAMSMLISVERPDVPLPSANLTLLLASLLALISYYLVRQYWRYFGAAFSEVLDATLALAYIPLVLALWYNQSAIIAPLSLGIAGGLTLFHVWGKSQQDREASGGVITAAFLWLLYTQGVHSLQAYTHIIAALFALYASWRSSRGDRAGSDNYLHAMLATATVPLALQAINGQAGDAYGWWLLLEQIGFMIVGILLRRRFVTFWGLYVAIGAVLYQLRHLGWAALSFLALFVIGIAIYRLLKTVDNRGKD